MEIGVGLLGKGKGASFLPYDEQEVSNPDLEPMQKEACTNDPGGVQEGACQWGIGFPPILGHTWICSQPSLLGAQTCFWKPWPYLEAVSEVTPKPRTGWAGKNLIAGSPTNQAGAKSLRTETRSCCSFRERRKSTEEGENRTQADQVDRVCTMDYRLRWKYRYSCKSREESERRYLEMGLNRLGKRWRRKKQRELKYVSNEEYTAFSN